MLLLHITILQTSYLTDPHCEISVLVPTKETTSEWLGRWLLFTKVGMTLIYLEPLNDSYWSNIIVLCYTTLASLFSLPSYFESFGVLFLDQALNFWLHVFFLGPDQKHILYIIERRAARSGTVWVRFKHNFKLMVVFTHMQTSNHIQNSF